MALFENGNPEEFLLFQWNYQITIELSGTITESVNIQYLLLLLLDQPPCNDGMHIVGWWCSTPCTEATETLDSVP